VSKAHHRGKAIRVDWLPFRAANRPCKMSDMTREDIIAALRAHEPELKAAGVLSLSLVGSFAREDAEDESDIDVVVRLTDDPQYRGFGFFGRIEELTRQLEAILGRPVDVLTEPIRKDRLRRRIERDRTVAF